jgi:hypothetical protein
MINLLTAWLMAGGSNGRWQGLMADLRSANGQGHIPHRHVLCLFKGVCVCVCVQLFDCVFMWVCIRVVFLPLFICVKDGPELGGY